MNYDSSLPYPGMPESLRARAQRLALEGILPDFSRRIEGSTWFVGQRVRHRKPAFGRPTIHVKGMGPLELAGRAGDVRGFFEYRGDLGLLVHWDGTPEYDPEAGNSRLYFFWCWPSQAEPI